MNIDILDKDGIVIITLYNIVISEVDSVLEYYKQHYQAKTYKPHSAN